MTLLSVEKDVRITLSYDFIQGDKRIQASWLPVAAGSEEAAAVEDDAKFLQAYEEALDATLLALLDTVLNPSAPAERQRRQP